MTAPVIYIGGDFTVIGTALANRVAKWDGTSWTALGTGLNSTVNALAVWGGEIYAGGGFTYSGGTKISRIAKWDGTSWSAVGSGVNNSVQTLAVFGTDLYVGGSFAYATNTGPNAVRVNYIARWNGTSWSTLGSGANSSITSLAVPGANLYAGGGFTYATNAGPVAVALNYMGKWDGSAWSALGTGVNNWVYALTVSGGELYAGGAFTHATNTGPGAVRVNYIAKWSGTSWSALGGGLDSTVFALTASSADLYAEATSRSPRTPARARSAPITLPSGTGHPGRPWGAELAAMSPRWHFWAQTYSWGDLFSEQQRGQVCCQMGRHLLAGSGFIIQPACARGGRFGHGRVRRRMVHDGGRQQRKLCR